MRRIFLFLFSLSLLIIAGCSCNNEDETSGIKRTDVILLSDTQVSNFILMLPDILEFSEKYHRSLSVEEKNREDANKKFFETLKKSKRMEKLASERGFKSIDELVVVYKNVVLGYMSIKLELQDFKKEFSNLSSLISSNENKLKKELKEKKIDEKEYEKQLKDIEIDKIRLSNILTIKKFETDIDNVTSQFNR
ncbi:MAG: hypothetical protein ACP5QT_03885 [Brevinematia bacterium]